MSKISNHPQHVPPKPKKKRNLLVSLWKKIFVTGLFLPLVANAVIISSPGGGTSNPEGTAIKCTGVTNGYLLSCVDATDRGSWIANGGITALTGDVTATGPGSVAATVATVGGYSAANVAAGATLANAATSANTASAIVKRDANKDFIARQHVSDSGTAAIGFIGAQNNTKPIFGSDLGSTNGLWNTTDGVWELRGGSASRLLLSGTNADYNGKLRQTGSGGFGGGFGLMYAQGFAQDTSTTQLGNTAATTTTLFSSTVGNSDWNTNKIGYRFLCAGTYTDNTDTDVQLTVTLGSTTIFDTGSQTITGAGAWNVEGLCVRTGSATQKCSVRYIGYNSDVPTKVQYTSGTETCSSALTLACKGKSTTASTVVGEIYKSWYDPD